MPERYTLGHHESVLRSHRWRTAENSAAYLLPHLRPGMDLLDVGSGPGTITIDLARSSRPVGSSASTRRRTWWPRRPGSPRSGASRTSSSGSPTPTTPDSREGSFDVVHAHQVLQHLARPVEALAAWRRMVAPDGLVAARDCDYVAGVVFPPTSGLELWKRTYQDLARRNHGNPDAGRRLKSWARPPGSRSSMRARPSGASRATPTATGGAGSGPTAPSSRSSPPGCSPRAAIATTLDAIREGWLGWVADPDGWMILPHGEILARG